MPNILFRLLALAVLLSSGLTARANDLNNELRVSCGGIFNLCGYSNANGEIIMAQRYESLRSFSEQLAAARTAGLWGFLGSDGKYVIDPVFKMVGDFHNGRAEVILDGNAGVIDKNGDFSVPPKFWRAIPLGRNAALVIEHDDSRKVRRRLEQNFLFDRFDLYHIGKGIVTNTPMEFTWFVRPGDDGPSDRIWASLNKNAFGLMDDQGNWLIEPQYSHVQSLHEDRAIVAVGKAIRDRLWGAVNADGQIVIPLKHNWLSYFDNGYGLVGGPGRFDQRKTGLIRPDGTIVGNRLFEKAERPSGDRPLRVMEDGIWYNFAEDESLVREEPDRTVVGSCTQGLKVVRDGRGYIVTNAAGERTLKERLDHIAFGIVKNGSVNGGSYYRREIDCSGPVAVGRGPLRESEWTYVRTDGAPLILGVWFTETFRFDAGYAIVKTGEMSRDENTELWGILNEVGEFTLGLGPNRISRRSSMLLPDGQPFFTIGKGADQRLVDAFGQLVKMPDAMKADKREQALRCSGGAHIVGGNAGFGIEGPDGATLVPSVHRAISCFQKGVAWAPNDELKQWCPIGPEGTFRSKPACIDYYYPYTISHHYPEDFSEDRFESNILWVRAWLGWGMGKRDEPPEWIGDGVMSRGSYSVRPFGGP